jgi:hypothetical protein
VLLLQMYEFIFWELPEMVPILFHWCVRAAQPPLHDDDPPCSDYYNWIPITYPTTSLSLACLVNGLFWVLQKLGEWKWLIH